MRRGLSLLMALLALAVVAPRPALATHTEMLRSVGDEFTTPAWALALFALATFLLVGSVIFLGYRYLYRTRGDGR